MMYEFAHLIIDECNTDENFAVKALLEENGIVFTTGYMDGPMPELTVGQMTYHGLEHIRSNLDTIKRQLQG